MQIKRNNSDIQRPALLVAAITTGLSAGLLFAYQVSINPAFQKLSDTQYIAAMQAINVAIQNPAFGLSFMGAGAFLLLATYVHRSQSVLLKFKVLAAATLLYLFGTLAVTFAANLPLNNTLAQFSSEVSTSGQTAEVRYHFQTTWNRWHTIRTLGAIGAIALVIVACLGQDTAGPGSHRIRNKS